jgi:hypothetical protein
MCLPHRCVATRVAEITKNATLLLLHAFSTMEMFTKQPSSSKLFRLSGVTSHCLLLKAIHPAEGCACDVCAWFHFPSRGSVFHGVYSATAPTAPSLRLLVLSGSLIRCQSTQIYHLHPAFPIGGCKTT